MTTPGPRLFAIEILGALGYIRARNSWLGRLRAVLLPSAADRGHRGILRAAGSRIVDSRQSEFGEREDRSNRWVLPVFGVIGFASAYLPAYTDRIGFWTIDGDSVRWLGVFLFAVGGALRIGPVFILGHRFSGLVAIQPGHTLVTDGLYGIIRHPSYLGLLVGALGWALTFRSGVGLALTALLIPPLLARIRAEEALLRSEFGAEYVAYRSRTWRLVPGLF